MIEKNHIVQVSCFKFIGLLISITQMWTFRILSDMRTLSADWMANTNKSESELQSSQHGGEESKANIFYPRAVAPTAAQVCITGHFSSLILTMHSSMVQLNRRSI